MGCSCCSYYSCDDLRRPAAKRHGFDLAVLPLPSRPARTTTAATTAAVFILLVLIILLLIVVSALVVAVQQVFIADVFGHESKQQSDRPHLAHLEPALRRVQPQCGEGRKDRSVHRD